MRRGAYQRSWTGTDVADVVLHSYRSRWGHAELDPAYAARQARFESTQTLYTPTLLLHRRCCYTDAAAAPTLLLDGAVDGCELEEATDGAERLFAGA